MWIFATDRYRQVGEAHLRGLERRLADDGPRDTVGLWPPLSSAALPKSISGATCASRRLALSTHKRPGKRPKGRAPTRKLPAKYSSRPAPARGGRGSRPPTCRCSARFGPRPVPRIRPTGIHATAMPCPARNKTAQQPDHNRSDHQGARRSASPARAINATNRGAASTMLPRDRAPSTARCCWSCGNPCGSTRKASSAILGRMPRRSWRRPRRRRRRLAKFYSVCLGRSRFDAWWRR
jgi:hypothetical protein